MIDLDLTFTARDYGCLIVILTIALALNLAYHFHKGSNEMKELALATLGAEVLLFLMWLALCGLHNI